MTVRWLRHFDHGDVTRAGTRWGGVAAAFSMGFVLVLVSGRASAAEAPRLPLDCVVKLYGAGVGRIEAYGSGLLVSPEGAVLTVLSPLLEARDLRAVLADGRRVASKVVYVDVTRELALLQLDADRLPSFDLNHAVSVRPGDVVWGLSNLFNIAVGSETVSVQRGMVAAITELSARQGFHQFTYPGEVFVLDLATSNPGAAGGALVDRAGRLVGMLGKEVKSTQTNTWISYAIPARDLQRFWAQAKQAAPTKPALANTPHPRSRLTTEPVDLRGLILLPDVLDRTPAFVDGVEAGSPAERAGLQSDDLVLFVEEALIQSATELRQAFAKIAADRRVRLVVLRGEDLVAVELSPRAPTPPRKD